jgi:hypothetical protein
MGALTANGEIAPMTEAPVAAQIHEALYVHRDIPAKIALDRHVGINILADGKDFGICQVVHAPSLCDPDSVADLSRDMRTYSVNVGKGNWHPLCSWDVHSGDSSHVSSSFRCGSVIPEPFFTTGPDT